VSSSDLPGVKPAKLNGILLYYRLMTKRSGLGDSTELSREGLSHFASKARAREERGPDRGGARAVPDRGTAQDRPGGERAGRTTRGGARAPRHARGCVRPREAWAAAHATRGGARAPRTLGLRATSEGATSGARDGVGARTPRRPGCHTAARMGVLWCDAQIQIHLHKFDRPEL
jgi:hypothetical protein